MRLSGLTVKDGKFYKDGQHVPIEHGNKEQIALLNKIQEFINDGIYPEIREKRIIEVMVKCPCGSIFEFSNLELEEDDPMDLLAGNTQSCHHCNVKYKLFCDNQGDLLVRMMPAKKRVEEGVTRG